MKQLIDLSALSGCSMYNEEYKLGLLFYYPTGRHQLRAQIWNLTNDDVLFETIVKDWDKALCALLTFQHITGQGSLEELTEKLERDVKAGVLDFLQV